MKRGREMTREDAITNIKALDVVCGQKEFYDEEFVEALSLAVKALEQEFVLDKLKAEIDDYLYNDEYGFDYRADIANIIDKYKAGIEGVNGEMSDITTNGDMIKTMFPDLEITEIRGSFDKEKLLGYRTWLGGRSQDFLIDWWNAPYEAESDEEIQDKTLEQQDTIDTMYKNNICQSCIHKAVCKYNTPCRVDANDTCSAYEPANICHLCSKAKTCKDKTYPISKCKQHYYSKKHRVTEDLPPATSQPKTGHWIEGKYKDTCDKCRCTYPKDIGFKNYCPNCGAKMTESEIEE